MPNATIIELAEQTGMSFDEAASLAASQMNELADWEDDNWPDEDLECEDLIESIAA